MAQKSRGLAPALSLSLTVKSPDPQRSSNSTLLSSTRQLPGIFIRNRNRITGGKIAPFTPERSAAPSGKLDNLASTDEKRVISDDDGPSQTHQGRVERSSKFQGAAYLSDYLALIAQGRSWPPIHQSPQISS